MVTSAQPLEGKTTTACNMAIALAIGGARVLLIDADMRRPGVHRTLDLENSAGLVAGPDRAGDAGKRDPNRRERQSSAVMTAGTLPPNPSELLASERMSALLARRRRAVRLGASSTRRRFLRSPMPLSFRRSSTGWPSSSDPR